MSMVVHLHPEDTIAALASAAGSGLRGIVRLSGPATTAVLEGLFADYDLGRSPSTETRSFPHSIPWCHAGVLKITGIIRPLPVDLYLWPSRRSYTGQPLAELHTIGS